MGEFEFAPCANISRKQLCAISLSLFGVPDRLKNATHLFFPEQLPEAVAEATRAREPWALKAKAAWTRRRHRQESIALSFCAKCPAHTKRACQKRSDEQTRGQFGIWAGQTEDQRRKAKGGRR